MGQLGRVSVAGFELALDRSYHPGTHMWVLALAPGRVRVGMDPLGIETSGTLAQLSFVPVGTELTAGLPFGQLEAAKFVGPLVSPVPGPVLAVNEAVGRDPGLAERDPYGAGWMIEAGADLPPGLLSGPAVISEWFAAKVADYRANGVIAE